MMICETVERANAAAAEARSDGLQGLYPSAAIVLSNEVVRLRSYLQEISIGRGAYSHDPQEHADNCIRDMKAEAVKALNGEPWEER